MAINTLQYSTSHLPFTPVYIYGCVHIINYYICRQMQLLLSFHLISATTRLLDCSTGFAAIYANELNNKALMT